MDNVILNKQLIIDRCLARIRDEFDDADSFRDNLTRQDSVVLNLQRACEAAIDMGNRVIRLYRFEIPQSARDVFAQLRERHVISAESTLAMQKMVGLRNIAVHDYQALNLDILIAVVTGHLSDFTSYAKQILAYAEQHP